MQPLYIIHKHPCKIKGGEMQKERLVYWDNGAADEEGKTHKPP